jgi:hypothetical protein
MSGIIILNDTQMFAAGDWVATLDSSYFGSGTLYDVLNVNAGGFILSGVGPGPSYGPSFVTWNSLGTPSGINNAPLPHLEGYLTPNNADGMGNIGLHRRQPAR